MLLLLFAFLRTYSLYTSKVVKAMQLLTMKSVISVTGKWLLPSCVNHFHNSDPSLEPSSRGSGVRCTRDSQSRGVKQPSAAALPDCTMNTTAEPTLKHSSVPELPLHIILHILSLLPDAHKAYAARLVNKAAHHEFQTYTVIPLSSRALPLVALQEAFHALEHTNLNTDTEPFCLRLLAGDIILGQQSKQAVKHKLQQLLAGRAACGDMTGLQWLHNRIKVAGLSCRCSPSCSSSICQSAAAAGQLDVLRWAHAAQPRSTWDSSTLLAAAAAGQLAVLQWAKDNKLLKHWNASLCSAAAKGGQLDTLQWLRSQDPPCPWDSSTCSSAAQTGQLHVLQWARAHKCPWDSKVASYAAQGGHLPILQWAMAQNPPCPWDSCVCTAAAQGCHLGILQWAKAHDPPCPWDASACRMAARGGRLEVLQWMRTQGPPCPWVKWQCEMDAAAGGHWQVLDWLRTVHVPD